MKRIVIFSIFLVIFAGPPAGAVSVHHNLRVTLDLSDSRLTGVDVMDIRPEGTGELLFSLTDAADELQVTVDGKPVRFRQQPRGVSLTLTAAQRTGRIQVAVTYTALFDDPVPFMPVNTDNPGYGVTGTIREKGAFLLAGAGWYPHIEAGKATYTIRVEAPEGIVSVTAGRSLGRETANGKTVSVWQIDRSVQGVSLSAGGYLVTERVIGNVKAATYFFEDSAHLSARYLDAVGDYLRFYEDLFGPYPFAKFAIVENFFPTGYGFPSYTLLGSRVLRLPFIIRTSLGHEIAHCWWGNGVYVDYRRGNWSEGLTTYVADYLYRERVSPAEAREYRRQLLRNYSTLVGPATEFALERFTSRRDPATRAIGYDKSAMVFHMLRQRLGDDAFWGALRDVFHDHLFKTISWDGFRKAFERRGKVNLKDFFDQWVGRSGAPQLAFDQVGFREQAGRFRVSGRIVQRPPFYDLTTALQLQAGGEVVTESIRISGRETEFEIFSADPPEKMTLDPDTDIFRKLAPTEIPPAVNSVKGASAVVVVLAEGLDESLAEAADILVRALGLKNVKMVSEDRLNRPMIKENDLIFVGLPRKTEYLKDLGSRTDFDRTFFVLEGTRYGDRSDTFFGVFAHPLDSNRTAALFLPLSSQYAGTAARKITHYGKYSYLVFRGQQNRAKGTWPVTNSPLIYRWPPGPGGKP